ncbi:MAG: hypothetical protein JXD18_06260 [Anaerolineae bacterium]|nr:hypothetical protein [Anaerolineae bacterium]
MRARRSTAPTPPPSGLPAPSSPTGTIHA